MENSQRGRVSKAIIGALVGIVGAGAAAPTASLRGGSLSASLTPVARFDHVPVGVAVSREHRVFLSFSRAIDVDQPFSLAELREGRAVPYPSGLAQSPGDSARHRLLSVQALAIDGRNRLWVLDCARIGNADPADPSAIQLVAIDLATNAVVRTITFPPDVAGPTAFFNDVVIDLRRGAGGTAYITDASPRGPNGIVVVDLASGKSFRRLNDHPSTRPDPECILRVEGEPLLFASGVARGKPLSAGVDGLALSADGGSLSYAPLSSRRWFRVDAAVLSDPGRSEAELARTIEDLGDKGFASDGLLGGSDGSVYLTDVENNAIRRRPAGGSAIEIVVQAPQLLWPDSMALASDGTLYFTATQIERGEAVRGADERRKPFTLWQVRVGTLPILLK